MANHFAHQFSKIMPATASTPNPTEALRIEVVPAILARMKLSAAFYFSFSPYRKDRENTFRRLLLEKPNGGSPRDLAGENGHQDVATKFSVVFEAVRHVWAERQGLDPARLPSRYYIDGDTPADQEAHFRWLFLSSPGDHPPRDPADEPSFEDRHDRHYVMADALRQELAAQHGFDPSCLYILIDPSGMRCEDTVYMAYLYAPDPLDLGQAVLLYAAAVPAGQRFATEDLLATYLAEQYAQLDAGTGLRAVLGVNRPSHRPTRRGRTRRKLPPPQTV